MLLSIAGLAALAGTAIGQTRETEPAWRASALAHVPPDLVAGEAYRTDDDAMTGYLAVYPANANEPNPQAACERAARRVMENCME